MSTLALILATIHSLPPSAVVPMGWTLSVVAVLVMIAELRQR